MFKSWDQLTVVEQLASEYSDFYKSVHGIRPRWMNLEAMTEAELRSELEWLGKDAEVVWAQEDQAQKEAIARFEERVTAVIATGAKNRETAIRWIFDAEDEYARNEPDYFCYNNGLPYGYFKKAA